MEAQFFWGFSSLVVTISPEVVVLPDYVALSATGRGGV
jgi:hypothetical protein